MNVMYLLTSLIMAAMLLVPAQLILVLSATWQYRAGEAGGGLDRSDRVAANRDPELVKR